jgi:hypothetical protein
VCGWGVGGGVGGRFMRVYDLCMQSERAYT